ncbi:MAG: pyridoxal phosphate-dependent aminotransferase, partial [Acidobacteriota bacterium]
GREIVDFSAGQPDVPSPAVAIDAACEALAAGKTRYTAAAGIPELRRAIARRYRDTYGALWSESDVVVTVGAKAALYEVMQILLDDGDEVILPTPAWVSFSEQIQLAGARPVTVPMSGDDGFTLHAEPLIAACTERTRMILVNSPSNPTGGVATADDLERLAAVAAERDVVLLCDETYERFVWQGEHASGASLAARWPEHVAVVGSFSKTWSMTGWRLGWLAGPRQLVDKVGELQSHLTSNPTAFAMYGGLAALEGADEAVERMRSVFAQRRELMVDGLARLDGVHCRPPAGAFYAFPDVSSVYGGAVSDSISFAERLLQDHGVATVPGAAFGSDHHVRLSFACSQDELRQGLERMADALAALRP